MKLATAKQVEELRASGIKRQAADELGPLLYDCWPLGIIRYLDARSKRQASSNKPASNKPASQQATSLKRSCQAPEEKSRKPQAPSNKRQAASH